MSGAQSDSQLAPNKPSSNHDREIPLHHLNKKKYFLGLSLAAIGEAALWYPLDKISTCQAVDRAKRPISVRDMTRSIYTKEGLRGFYTGFETQLLGQCIIDSFYFLCLESTKSLFFDNDDQNTSNAHKFFRGFSAGLCAELFANLLIVPLDNVISKIQIQSLYESPIYRNSLHCARHIYTAHGLTGFFRGFGGSMVYLTAESAIFWAFYDCLRFNLCSADLFVQRPSYAHFLAGGLSGVITAILTNPLVVSTIRLQTQDLTSMMQPSIKKHSNFITCLTHTLKHEGYSGLMKGTPSRCAWMFIEKALLTSIYEQVKLFALKDEFSHLYHQL